MKFVFALIALITQVACAQPNYQDVKTLEGGGQQKAGTCGLTFKTQDLCANYTWVTKPTEDDMGSFTIHFTQNGVAADPALTVKVVVWMPDMGHGSSPVKITKQATGEYLAENVFFSMHGNWQLRFQLLNAKAVVEEQVADVTF